MTFRLFTLMIYVVSMQGLLATDIEPPFAEYADKYDAEAIRKVTALVRSSTILGDPDQSFLQPPEGRDPFHDFLAMSEGLRPLRAYPNPAMLYIPEFAHLARACLEKMTSHLDTEMQEIEIDLFSEEIKVFEREKRTTYLWYTLFMDRLSMLLTHPDERGLSVGPNGNGYSHYKAILMKSKNAKKNRPLFYSHSDYLYMLMRLDSPTTQYIASPIALSIHHFPLLITYPYELDEDLITASLPTDQSGAWFSGLPMRSAWADGNLYSPGQFKAHDDTHFLFYLQSFTSQTFVRTIYTPLFKQQYFVPDKGICLKIIEHQQKMVFDAVEAVKSFLHHETSREMKQPSILPFLLLHEELDTLSYMRYLTSGDYVQEQLMGHRNGRFLTPKDLGGLLSNEIQMAISLVPSDEEKLEICWDYLRGVVSHFQTLFSQYCDSIDPSLKERIKDKDLVNSILKFIAPVDCSHSLFSVRVLLPGTVIFRDLSFTEDQPPHLRVEDIKNLNLNLENIGRQYALTTVLAPSLFMENSSDVEGTLELPFIVPALP